jgi:lipoprotein-anchoring transpeptidase ErfK/SrfK
MRSLLAVLAASICTAPALAAPPANQELLALDRAATARSQPSAVAAAVARVARLTPLTHAQAVLPVVRHRVGDDGREWLLVRLPGRPNGAAGWVRAAAGTLSDTPWRIVVFRAARRAEVLDGETVRAGFRVVVGKPATPTPLGTFFVVEELHLGRHAQQGPWALATSAYSNVLQEFAGGPGQIALHGRVGLAAPLGTAASHGCVRFANGAITWIAEHVPAGTPVVVRP